MKMKIEISHKDDEQKKKGLEVIKMMLEAVSELTGEPYEILEIKDEKENT